MITSKATEKWDFALPLQIYIFGNIFIGLSHGTF